jgi:hypothetical protein
MPTLQADAIGDLIKTTLNELGEMRFTEIATDLQNHVAMSKLLKKNKVTFDAGPLFQWDVMTDHNHSARAVGLYAQDNVNVPDVMTQGQVPWRHVTHNYAIERREVAMNRSPRKIVDLLKTRRIASMISMAEFMEDRVWKLPASNDTLNFYGIPYWVVKSASEGFNTSAPSGYTTVGNINPLTYNRWANWAAAYTQVSKEDLVRKLRKAFVYTNWKPPVDGIPTFNTGDSYELYSNYAVVGPMEELLEAQNDSLGNDVASKDGQVLVRKTPLQWIPKLDEDTTNPCYGINWGEFKVAALRGEWLNETQIPIQPGQHTVSAVHIDLTMNLFTRNRRRHFVVSNGTTLPA